MGWLKRLTATQKLQRLKKKIQGITRVTPKTALNRKTTEIENKIPDASHFVNTPGFKRLANISFNTTVKEAVKSLACKIEAD